MKRLHRFAAAAVFAFVAAGCGGSDKSGALDPTGKDKMQEIAEMLKTLQADNAKPPARAADLARVDPMLPLSAEALRTGDIVYAWGATLSPADANKVLAYEKKVESDGGWVLMQDGQAKQMTAVEFKSAPKAK